MTKGASTSARRYVKNAPRRASRIPQSRDLIIDAPRKKEKKIRCDAEVARGGTGFNGFPGACVITRDRILRRSRNFQSRSSARNAERANTLSLIYGRRTCSHSRFYSRRVASVTRARMQTIRPNLASGGLAASAGDEHTREQIRSSSPRSSDRV